MKKFWLFCFNVLYYGSSAFLLPNLVSFYQSMQFSGIEIGILTGATPLIYLISTPFFTNLADSKGWHRPIMLICLSFVILSIALMPFANTYSLIFLLVVCMYIFLGPIVPFVDSATIYMLGDEKEMYGRVRLGGTIGWAVVALIAGVVVEAYGLNAAFWGSALLLTFPLFMTGILVFPRTKMSKELRPSVRSLLQNPLWIRFLAIAFVAGVAFSVSNSYLFVYLDELGTPESMKGIALSLGTVMEIPALFYGNLLLARIKPYSLLIAAMLLTALRLCLLASTDALWFVLLIQPLGGLAFISFWLAGVAYANEHAPENLSATAQGLFGAMIFGFGSAVGGLLAGLLLERMNVHGIYLVVGIAVFVSLFVISAIWRLLPDTKLKNA